MNDYQKQSLDKIIDDLVYSNGGRLQVECLIDFVEKIYQQGRADAIDEFKKALKEKYPLMYNEFGMEFNTNIHQHIDEVAEQIKEQTNAN